MATSFKIPKSPEVQIYQNETFLGADFTTDVGNVDDTKSPDVVNMIRSIPGKVRKRMGYKQVCDLSIGSTKQPIYGVHYYSYADVWLIHAKDKLYQFKGGSESFWVDHNSKRMGTEDYYKLLFTDGEIETVSDMHLLYTGMAERRSTAYELNQMLVILDGKKMLYVHWQSTDDHLTCGRMEDYPNKTIPLVRISCTADGAGTDYQPFNLLSPRFEQDYLITETGKRQLQLYTDKLTDDPVVVYILSVENNEPVWTKWTEGTDFWVDRDLGQIKFDTTYTYDDIVSATASGYPADYIVEVMLKNPSSSVPMQHPTSVFLKITSRSTGKLVTNPEQFTVTVTTAGGHTYSKQTPAPKVAKNEDRKSGGSNYNGESYTLPGGSDDNVSYLFAKSAKKQDEIIIGNWFEGNHDNIADNWAGSPTFGTGVYFSTSVSFSDKVVTATSYKTLPATPITGQDNVKVVASYKSPSAGVDLINKCRFGVLFGVNGASDRLFVSGNNSLGDNLDENGNPTGTTYSNRNRDWYSQRYDPTYFPDVGYSVLGSDGSAIVGYAVVNSFLATFKDTNEMSQTVFIREGDMFASDLDGDGNEESTPTFKLINTLQGAGAISSYCIDYLQTEPVFLSKLGIYALTSQDITGEKYGQNRSYYLNKKLLSERNLSEAVGFVYKDYYVLCVNNHFYILDGLQPLRADKSEPYATRQYAGFYFEFNLNPGEIISYAWEMYGMFYFGTTHGRVMRFYRDEKDLNSYNDNGNPIEARWQTPDISGRLFYKNKTFRYVALKVTPARNSSVLIEGQKHGVWEDVKEEYAKIKYFSFIDLTFARTPKGNPIFTFMCDKTQKVITTKTRIKKIDKVQFRFSNSEVNEPLGLNKFALEYTQGGNIK